MNQAPRSMSPPRRLPPTRPAAPEAQAEEARTQPVEALSDDSKTGGGRKAVYTIIEYGAGKPARWLRIGIAFLNRDGSLNVKLDALPVTGTLHIRDFPPRESDEAGE